MRDITREERTEKKNKFFSEIEGVLFPHWCKIGGFSSLKIDHWKELIKLLYRCKGLNKENIYSQIEYIKSQKSAIK